MNTTLQKKIDFAIMLLKSAEKAAESKGQPVEICYSGGKDSDVILELAKMAGIKYRAIYKNTTIDPPGTIQHVREMGVEMVRPAKTFFELMAQKGYPSRFVRFCCSYLKEYKILDRAIMGVRREESYARAKRYIEPTKCLFYGSKKSHVEAFYPILDWNEQDIAEFVSERKIKCHPLYYDEQGNFHPERRLGCLCCPLACKKQRIAEFKKYPNMVKAYLRGGQKFRDAHPNAALTRRYDNIYDAFVRFLFFNSDNEFRLKSNGLFGKMDCKQFLEEQFNVKL